MRGAILTLSLLLLSAGVQALLTRDAPSLDKRALHNVTSQNKAGLAWTNTQSTGMGQFLGTGKVGWYYTWSSSPSGQGDSLDFVPQLWGAHTVETWTNAITTVLKSMFESKAITHVLGFSEPQEVSQSNLNVQQALSLWMTYIQPLKTQYGVRLGSPAPSSASNGKTWMAGFLQACQNRTGCSVDFIALHYYSTNATAMINYITDFHTTFQLPIWVTEWVCQDFTTQNLQCDQQTANSYMSTTQTFMDKTNWVERYSWFGANIDNPWWLTPVNYLVNPSGSITALGQQYILPSCASRYKSVAGDTCVSLEAKFGLRSGAILAANTYLNCNDIWANTDLCIPSGGVPNNPTTNATTSSAPPSPTCVQTYISVAGDTCSSIQVKFGLGSGTILAANSFLNCSDIWSGTPICIPPGGSTCTQTISSTAGATCDSIGSQYGVSGAQIKTWNDFLNCADIWTNTPVCVKH